jgi:hypothetical protein
MGWPIKKKYDPLRIIAPIISQEAGNGKLFEKLMVMVENFRILLDLLGCDLTEELEVRVGGDHGVRRDLPNPGRRRSGQRNLQGADQADR